MRRVLLVACLAAQLQLLGAFVTVGRATNALRCRDGVQKTCGPQGDSCGQSLLRASKVRVQMVVAGTPTAESAKVGAATSSHKSVAKPVLRKEMVQGLFEQIDMDGDGFISHSELQNLADSLKCEVNEAKIKEIVTSMDSDKDGFVGLSDFFTWYTTSEGSESQALLDLLKKKVSRDNAMILFSSIDTDKSGTIDISELQKLCAALGNKWPKEKAQQVLAAIDKDGNGVIDFEEFFTWFTLEGEELIGLGGAAAAELRIALQKNPFLDERRLFVRGFPPKADEEAVTRFFSKMGDIESVTMLRWSRDGRPSGRSIITFADRAGAEAALRMHRKHMGPRYLEVYRVNCGDSEERVPLDPTLHGAVIGVGGGTLKRIEKETGARLFLQTNGTRGTLFIKGTDEERAAARSGVQAVVSSDAPLRIPIESSMAGLVIGAGGRTRARIEKESGAMLSVRDDGAAGSVYTSSVVLLRGTARQTARAYELILDELDAQTEDKRRLHPKYHGNLMGRGGATVMALQRATGTRIRFVREPEGAVFIRGPRAARAAAWELLVVVRETLPPALQLVRAGPVPKGALASRPEFEGEVPPDKVWPMAVEEALHTARRIIADNRPELL